MKDKIIEEARLAELIEKERDGNRLPKTESLLESSWEAQAFAHELNDLPDLLTEGFREEPLLFLTEQQKDAIFAGKASRTEKTATPYYQFIKGVGIAACATFATFLGIHMMSESLQNHSAVDVIVNSEPSGSLASRGVSESPTDERALSEKAQFIELLHSKMDYYDYYYLES